MGITHIPYTIFLINSPLFVVKFQNELSSSKESDSGMFWAHQWNSNEENREQVQPLYGQKQVLFGLTIST